MGPSKTAHNSFIGEKQEHRREMYSQGSNRLLNAGQNMRMHPQKNNAQMNAMAGAQDLMDFNFASNQDED